MRMFLALWIAKLVTSCIRLSGLGAAKTWPGEIALRVTPDILTFFASKNPTIIMIAGTNGKTTTSTMIESILNRDNRRVCRNTSGANLDNGVVSTFLDQSSWTGNLSKDIFVFEVDEATVPILLKSLRPRVFVCTNLFRDQLDRYGEVDTIAEKWQQALASLDTSTILVANADDPHIAYIASQSPCTVVYFGLNNTGPKTTRMQHAVDSIYCPRCGKKLTFTHIFYSHLGVYRCQHCTFAHPKSTSLAKEYKSPLPGVYNEYNTLASALVGEQLGVQPAVIQDGLAAFKPAFGRMEKIRYFSRDVHVILSKNPAGMNESLRTALALGASHLLIVLNDRIPDGRDVSWIWDVDMEQIPESCEVYVSGDRAYDLAVRLEYARSEKTKPRVYSNLENAIHEAVSAIGENQALYILPTYSAMLDVRKILTGKKIE